MAESPGFTGIGAPSLPGFPISPLPGQCINSQPWLPALTHCVAPLMRGARGAGAAGPVLLACHQWDPSGLARWLPSTGAGAWRSAPLLLWWVQCPGYVCAALAAGSGGSGRYLVSCLPRFPLLAPRVLRCVWRAVLSGCPLPSLAGTPFHAVCAFRGLGPVALLVFPACPLCVCALALPRRLLPPPPLPWLVWRAHLARSRCWALVGPFHAVRAPPRVLPRSPAPFGVLGGGAAWSCLPPTWGCALPVGWVCASGAFLCRGVGWGWGGGGLCAVPPDCAAGGGGGAGGRPASFRPSAFNGQATKRPSLASLWSWRAWPPYRSGLCSLAVSGRGPCGALARWRGFACSPWFLREQAAGAGGRALLRPPSLAPRSCQGEGGSSLCLGGLGAGAPAACWPVREGGGRGRAVAPLLSLWGAACGSLPSPLLVASAFPPGVRVRSGSRDHPMGRVRPAWRGGGRGPASRPPGGSDRPSPSLCPPRAGNIAVVSGDALVMGGAAPILFRFFVVCRPQAGSVRRSGALVRVQLRLLPGAAVPSGGGGTSPLPWEGGGPAPPRLAGQGGSGGGRGGRVGCAAAPRPPAPPVAPVPATLSLWRAPLGCTHAVGVAGRPRRRARPGRPPVGQCGGGGGGKISSPWSAPLPSPGQPQSGPPRMRLPGCRRSVVGR